MNPCEMVGVMTGNIDLEFKGQLVVKAFIKRAARVAEQVFAINTVDTGVFKFEPPTGIASQARDVQEIHGQEVFAEVLATLWRHCPEKDIDTEGCIKNACVQRLPFHWRADML